MLHVGNTFMFCISQLVISTSRLWNNNDMIQKNYYSRSTYFRNWKYCCRIAYRIHRINIAMNNWGLWHNTAIFDLSWESQAETPWNASLKSRINKIIKCNIDHIWDFWPLSLIMALLHSYMRSLGSNLAFC